MQNGFFDLKLGDSLARFQGLLPRGNYERKFRFTMPSLPLAQGEVTFEYVYLLFYKNRLHSIRCRTLGQISSEKFLDMLFLLYGPGRQAGFAPRYEWEGQHVGLLYDRNILSGNAEIVFTSKAVDRVFRQDFVQIGP